MADKNGDVNNTERCKCDLEYVSVACNRTPLCLDWGRNGWVAFGACYSVALCRNPKRVNAFGKIEYILNGHKDRVNCVKWITQPSFGDEIELISGSTDKSVIVWQKISDPDCNIHWRASDVLEGHQGAVNSVAGINIPSSNKEEQRAVITSASVDSTVRIWERKGAEDHFICLQTVSFGKGFILALALSILPRTTVPVIACGGEDNRLHLFVEKDNNFKQFVRVQSLLGHEDWIRDVEFATEDSGNLLLTSCAQDAFIRIWRISCVSKIESEMELLEHDGLQELKLTSNVFHVTVRGSEKEFAVVLESVLTGHEGWIYGIEWQPAVRRGMPDHKGVSLANRPLSGSLEAL